MLNQDIKEAKPNNNWLILGSIDLCNSTYIKSLFENKSEIYKSSLYNDYCTILNDIEFYFYSLLFKNYFHIINPCPKYNIRKGFKSNMIKKEENILLDLFVFKHIGDEVWFCIEIKRNDVLKLINVCKALYQTVTSFKTNWITILKKNNNINPELKHLKITFKAYFELVEEYKLLSEYRVEGFKQNINNLLITTKGPIEPDEALRDNLFEKLDCGYIIDNSNRSRMITKFRTDYIGYEVDRFFRFTKYAISDFFCIGEKLFSKLNLHNNNEYLVMDVYNNLSLASSYYYISKNHKPKGIDKFYKIYYLYKQSEIDNFINSFPSNGIDDLDKSLKDSFAILLDLCSKYDIKIPRKIK